MFIAVLLYLLLSLLLLTHPGFFNGTSELFESDVLKYGILFHFIMWILSAFRNPTSTRLPLSGYMVTLFCDMIALTAGRPFFLPMASTPFVVSSFLLGRTHLLKALTSLNLYFEYVEVNISLNNFSSLSFLPSFFLSFGKDPYFHMLTVMVLSQHRLSTSKTVSPRIPVGARCTRHVRMMCSAVCSAAPHSQFNVGARPHLCMND